MTRSVLAGIQPLLTLSPPERSGDQIRLSWNGGPESNCKVHDAHQPGLGRCAGDRRSEQRELARHGCGFVLPGGQAVAGGLQTRNQ